MMISKLNINIKIKKLKNLALKDKISKEAKKLVNSADLIIYITPYSSLYPTYYVKDLKEILIIKTQ